MCVCVCVCVSVSVSVCVCECVCVCARALKNINLSETIQYSPVSFIFNVQRPRPDSLA